MSFDLITGLWFDRSLASDWSRQIMWPEYWPQIGPDRSFDLNTGLRLVQTDHVTWILASRDLKTQWSRLITWLDNLPGHQPETQPHLLQRRKPGAQRLLDLWGRRHEGVFPRSPQEADSAPSQVILASDWLRQITWPEYLPLIGQEEDQPVRAGAEEGELHQPHRDTELGASEVSGDNTWQHVTKRDKTWQIVTKCDKTWQNVTKLLKSRLGLNLCGVVLVPFLVLQFFWCMRSDPAMCYRWVFVEF